MNEVKNIESMIRYSELESPSALANQKLDELISMIEDHTFDHDDKISLQNRFNAAVERSKSMKSFRAFELLEDDGSSRVDMAANLELLLSKHDLDSKMSKKYLILENAKLITQLVIAFTLVALGFAMIILPAPRYFEMFTLFYLNPNDGVTIMDVISLLIVFTGVYLLIAALLKLRK